HVAALGQVVEGRGEAGDHGGVAPAQDDRGRDQAQARDLAGEVGEDRVRLVEVGRPLERVDRLHGAGVEVVAVEVTPLDVVVDEHGVVAQALGARGHRVDGRLGREGAGVGKPNSEAQVVPSYAGVRGGRRAVPRHAAYWAASRVSAQNSMVVSGVRFATGSRQAAT